MGNNVNLWAYAAATMVVSEEMRSGAFAGRFLERLAAENARRACRGAAGA